MLLVMTTLYEGGHAPQITQRHRLRIAREEAGYDQTTLAEAIGVSRNTVNNAETGRAEPRRIVLNAWAMACGVPVSWLITGVDPAPPEEVKLPWKELDGFADAGVVGHLPSRLASRVSGSMLSGTTRARCSGM